MAGSFDSHPHNIGNLLGQYEPRRIVVPQFQRGYSWEKAHVSTFWDDVLSFRKSAPKGETYFLGPIVLLPTKDEISLLDGQQRLATVTILLSVLRTAARSIANNHNFDEGHNLARDIQRDLIGKKEKGKYALALGELDRAFFLKTVQEDPSTREEPQLRSHNLINNCRDFLASAVQEKIANLSPEEAIEELAPLRDTVATGITMVAIEVQSEDDAFSIFETLNDRGLRLSVPDLLLNHLMRTARAVGDKKQVRERWDLMLERMGKRDIDAFLRHMWLSKYGDLKARGLFREIKDKLTTNKVKSVKFADECSTECELYATLLDLDEKALGQARKNVRGLVRYLSVSSSLPLLLSGLKCLSASDFVKLSRMAVGLAVRHSVFANLNPSDLESAFYMAARSIRQDHTKKKDSAKCLSGAKTILAKYDPSDDQVESGAQNLLLTRSQGVYLLTGVANAMQSTTSEVGVDDANLEHIFPLHPSSDWTNVKELEPYKWHLGNLTVLSSRLNREAANSGFSTKLKHYAKSELKVTQHLTALSDWNRAAVLSRAALLAKTVTKAWTL